MGRTAALWKSQPLLPPLTFEMVIDNLTKRFHPGGMAQDPTSYCPNCSSKLIALRSSKCDVLDELDECGNFISHRWGSLPLVRYAYPHHCPSILPTKTSQEESDWFHKFSARMIQRPYSIVDKIDREILWSPYAKQLRRIWRIVTNMRIWGWGAKRGEGRSLHGLNQNCTDQISLLQFAKAIPVEISKNLSGRALGDLNDPQQGPDQKLSGEFRVKGRFEIHPNQEIFQKMIW